MNKPPIRILSNLARTGGTLVSRCLGSMDHIALLSEIHPLGISIFNPVEQARDWYGFTIPTELQGKTYDIIKAIQLIDQYCTRIGKTLVIRDWAHLDFIGTPFIKNPGYQPQLPKLLSKHFEIVQFAIVRHPIDQWLSISKLNIMQGHLDVEKFLRGTRCFAEKNADRFIKFETFTADTAAQMQILCNNLQTEYDPSFISQWQNNTKVTGDTSKTSRGSKSMTISPLRRLPIHKKHLEIFYENSDYQHTIEILGYSNPATNS